MPDARILPVAIYRLAPVTLSSTENYGCMCQVYRKHARTDARTAVLAVEAVPAVTGHLADMPTRRLPTHGLDISRTGQLAD